MVNTIQIKRGKMAPGAGILADGELGFSKNENCLYIGKDGQTFPVGLNKWENILERPNLVETDTRGLKINWNGSINSTNWLCAWENETTIRGISPSSLSVKNADTVDGYHINSDEGYTSGTSNYICGFDTSEKKIKPVKNGQIEGALIVIGGVTAASFVAGGKKVIIEGDTRLTNSRPASDVSAWAKGKEKPKYTYSEVGAAHAWRTGSGEVLASKWSFDQGTGTWSYSYGVSNLKSGDNIIVTPNSPFDAQYMGKYNITGRDCYDGGFRLWATTKPESNFYIKIMY